MSGGVHHGTGHHHHGHAHLSPVGGHGSIITRITRRKRRFAWPQGVLYCLLFTFLVCGAATMGMYAYLTWYQARQHAPIPWYFPYIITVSILTLIFVAVAFMLWMMQLLLPILVIIPSFILFVLWITALVKQSIELWGPQGSVNDYCVRYVYNDAQWVAEGRNRDTWARIQQEGVCSIWKTTFALELIATFLFMFMVFVSWQVWRSAR